MPLNANAKRRRGWRQWRMENCASAFSILNIILFISFDIIHKFIFIYIHFIAGRLQSTAFRSPWPFRGDCSADRAHQRININECKKGCFFLLSVWIVNAFSIGRKRRLYSSLFHAARDAFIIHVKGETARWRRWWFRWYTRMDAEYLLISPQTNKQMNKKNWHMKRRKDEAITTNISISSRGRSSSNSREREPHKRNGMKGRITEKWSNLAWRCQNNCSDNLSKCFRILILITKMMFRSFHHENVPANALCPIPSADSSERGECFLSFRVLGREIHCDN